MIENIQTTSSEKKIILNKDRFDTYDEAWNCFSYEIDNFEFMDGTYRCDLFGHWMFEPYQKKVEEKSHGS